LLQGTILTQPHLTSGGGGGDADAQVLELAADIFQKVPEPFDVQEVAARYPIMYANSMNTVLKQVCLSTLLKRYSPNQATIEVCSLFAGTYSL